MQQETLNRTSTTAELPLGTAAVCAPMLTEAGPVAGSTNQRLEPPAAAFQEVLVPAESDRSR